MPDETPAAGQGGEPSGIRAAPPPPRTSLIGREGLLSEIGEALRATRLVTVLGPGGVGKTRVATEVARRSSANWSDGVVWLDLTALPATGGVMGLIAGALGLREAHAGDLASGVVSSIGERRLLVVLDNCEHVVDDAAGAADDLLGSCPSVMVLATSREVLAVAGEVAVPVPPLGLAPESRTAKDILASDAVRLLQDRARAVVPTFTLTEADAADAARLCSRLDGLPLAIELAAARLRVLTLRQVADGLDDVFQLLVTRNRSAPQRHHSLRAALDWSYDLLTPAEQALLAQVSVFPADFDLAAAAAVAASTPGQVLDAIARLVEKSFVEVVVEAAGRSARYRLLEIVRRYAAERLAAPDAGRGEAAVRDRHAAYFAAMAVSAAPRLTSADGAAVLDLLDAELPNLDAALRHLVGAGRTSGYVPLAGALWRLCYLRGHYRQGREWLDAAASAAAGETGGPDGDAPTGDLVDVFHGSGVLAFLQCDYDAAVRRLERALELARRLDDPERSAAALQMLGGVAREQRRYARAQALYAESEALYAAAGSVHGVARARNYQSFLAWLQGHEDVARERAGVALQAFRRLGDAEGIVWALLNLGAVALLAGALDDAAELLRESAQTAHAVDFVEGRSWTSHLLGLLAVRRADPLRAVELLVGAARAHGSLGDRWRLASVLADLACVRAAGARPGDADVAARLFGAAELQWETIGSGPAAYEQDWQDEGRAACRSVLGDDAYAGAWQLGRAAPVDELLRAAVAEPAEFSPAEPRGGAVVDLRDGHRVTALGAVASGLRVSAFGGCRVAVAGRELGPADWGYAKPRELFFLLACLGPMTKERIGTTMWPDLEPSQLRGALHTALRDLRRALPGTGWVVYDRGRYALAEHDVVVDVREFEAALATARACRDGDQALPHLVRAVELYRGDLLPDLRADWVDVRRDALRQACTRALLEAGRALAAARRVREAARLLQRAVVLDPLLEVAHRDLMICWVKAGEPGLALQQYDSLAARLEADLGVRPSAQTRALAEKIRTRG